MSIFMKEFSSKSSNGVVIESGPELSKWIQLATFQTNIAKRWRNRGRSSSDEFARFFFYFASFNALYFLWSRVDFVNGGEEKQIHNLLSKLFPVAHQITQDLKSTVCFFVDHPPIQRMDRRNNLKQLEGDTKEGEKWRSALLKDDFSHRLLALGSILYLVRSNLVHGSKMESGDDKEIIRQAVSALEHLLDKCLDHTQSSLKEANR
jgi:hypothetical protein